MCAEIRRRSGNHGANPHDQHHNEGGSHTERQVAGTQLTGAFDLDPVKLNARAAYKTATLSAKAVTVRGLEVVGVEAELHGFGFVPLFESGEYSQCTAMTLPAAS